MSLGIWICVSSSATSGVTSVTYAMPASASPDCTFGMTAFTSSSFETTFASSASEIPAFARTSEHSRRPGRLGGDHELDAVLAEILDSTPAGLSAGVIVSVCAKSTRPGRRDRRFHRVHPGSARRGEHVDRCALDDLPRQAVGRPEAQSHLGPGVCRLESSAISPNASVNDAAPTR